MICRVRSPCSTRLGPVARKRSMRMRCQSNYVLPASRLYANVASGYTTMTRWSVSTSQTCWSNRRPPKRWTTRTCPRTLDPGAGCNAPIISKRPVSGSACSLILASRVSRSNVSSMTYEPRRTIRVFRVHLPSSALKPFLSGGAPRIETVRHHRLTARAGSIGHNHCAGVLARSVAVAHRGSGLTGDTRRSTSPNAGRMSRRPSRSRWAYPTFSSR